MKKMMRMFKVVAVLLVLVLLFCMAGCEDVSVSEVKRRLPDNVSVNEVVGMYKDGFTVHEIMDRYGIDMDDEAVADVISDLPDDVVETIIEDGLVPTSSGLDLLEEDIVESEPTPEPTPEPHVHQYVESITVQPTCAVAGEKTMICECGDVITESVPATGGHNWVEQTTVVHHDELGHVEQSRVLTGYTNPHTEYECAFCGYRADTPSAIVDHCFDSAAGNINHAFAQTYAYDYPAEPIYETQSKWVVDQEAYDSVEVVGYYCSVCGAVQ